MGGLLFVSQAMLDSWAEQGKIDFVGSVMTLVAADGAGRGYALEPAVRFLEVIGADADPHGLVHRVKSVAQLRDLGAEAVDRSCILGDVAYEVEPGFLAEASAIRAVAAAPPSGASRPVPRPAARTGSARAAGSPIPPTPLPCDLAERRKEAEALARFLLENVS